MLVNGKLNFTVNDVFCTYRSLLGKDVTDNYINTLIHDSGFIENTTTNLESQKKYVANIAESASDILFGLYYGESLVGTTGVQLYDDFATIGILVFDNYRRKGLGKILIWAASACLYNFLNIKQYVANAKVDNKPSINLFLACGFISHGVVVINNSDYLRFTADNESTLVPDNISDIEIISNA